MSLFPDAVHKRSQVPGPSSSSVLQHAHACLWICMSESLLTLREHSTAWEQHRHGGNLGFRGAA